MGCLGCGCLVLVLLVILVVGLVAGGCYLGYEKMVGFTSTTPADVPSFNGSDDVYNAAEQKITAFEHDVQNHQAATIQLSGDEINTLIARDPEMIRQKVHLFVTLTNDLARMQGSVPTSVFAHGFLKDRYLNFDSTFGLGFNSDVKSVDIALHHLQVSDQAAPENLLPSAQVYIGALLNANLQQSPATKDLLQQAKSIEIKDGELTIETQ